MNGKQAKKIRRAAEEQTVGKHIRNYQHQAKQSVRGGQLGLSNTILLTKDCTRKRIKKLKREFYARTRIFRTVRIVPVG